MTAEVLTSAAPSTPEVAVVDVPVVEKTIETTEEAIAAELEKELAASVSFKEETNVVGELPDSQKKALDELKKLVQEALNKRELTAPPPPPKEEKAVPAVVIEPEAPKVEEEKVEETAPVEEAEPKKTSMNFGFPKVGLWGRKSVTETPKVEEPKEEVAVSETEEIKEQKATEETTTPEAAATTEGAPKKTLMNFGFPKVGLWGRKSVTETPKVEEPKEEVAVPETEEIKEQIATEETTTTPEAAAATTEGAPKKTSMNFGFPKVSLPWGRKSVTETPKVEDEVTAPEAVAEEINEEIVTAPAAAEQAKEEEIVTAPAAEESKEEVEEPKKKKKNWGIPKVNINWGSKKDKTPVVDEPKKEGEEVTVPATEEPKDEVTVTAPAEEVKEEVTVVEESKEEVTVAAPPEKVKEEVTVPVVEAPKEEITAPAPEVTAPAAEAPAIEEPTDKEVISMEPEKVEVSAVDEPKEEITALAAEAPAVEEEPKDKEVISTTPKKVGIWGVLGIRRTPKAVEEEVGEATPVEPEEVSIWGVPLLADEKSDVVLLKFLRARDFKVKEAFAMLKNTVRWQKEFKIDAILEEDLGTELDKVVYMSGVDKQGHPVCYNVYGEFQNKELYESTFADAEKPEKFIRWRVQFLEKTIRKDLNFSPNGVCTFLQVNDLKASPGPFKRELKVATDQALHLLQDNYPEFVAKQVFINVPWYYLAYYKMRSPFFTQRTKSKFVFAGPSRSTETLFKYIALEQVPVQFGGLKMEGEQEFSTADTATEEIIKPSAKSIIEIPCSEALNLVWETRVIGWDVLYGAEFVPSAEGGYTVIIQKLNKIAPADETVLSGNYKASEAGKVVLTFDNSSSSKKKKLLYRSKAKPSE